MDYRILGPLEVRDGATSIGLGGEKQRAVLAILLLHGNEVVPAERLIEELWGESPPPSALSTLRSYVSRLRKSLGRQHADGVQDGHGSAADPVGDREPNAADGVLWTRGRGYVMAVAPGELDLARFRELAERGRDALAAGRPEQAGIVLREALSLWRGPPLAEFAYRPFAQAAIAQLEELHLAAVEDRVQADLTLGCARELIGELRDLVQRHPLRERLRGQLMLALYRSGRQAEALAVYQEFRRAMSEQLGLEPGPGLRQLELAILGHDQALDLPASVPAPQPRRAGVSTLRAVMARADVRRLTLTVAGLVLIALVLVVASSGGAKPLIPSNSIGQLDPSDGSLSNVVAVGASPSALAVGEGAVWAVDYNAGTVAQIDPANCVVTATIHVGRAPSGIAVGAGAVWVTDSDSARVLRIDSPVHKGGVRSIPVGRAPIGVAVGEGSVWVANSGDGTLTRIDATSAEMSTTIAVGGTPSGVVVGTDGVWVSDRADGRVLRVDPQTDQVIGSVKVGTGPTAIAVGFGSVWVANSLDGTISRIDPATNAVDATIAVGDGAAAIAIMHDSVWVANQYSGTVSRIDPATNAAVNTFKVGNRVAGLAIADGTLWVGSQPAQTRHRGGTLTVLSRGWLDTFDPALTHTASGALELTNDGLTAYQRVGGSRSAQLVPDLAVSLPSPTHGGTTYTFQLRPGIRYSSGELIRPEDFRRALERELILGHDSAYGGPFANVVGGTACAANPGHCDLSRGVVVDDIADAVTFHLVAPNPEFLARLTLADAVAVPAGTPNRDIGAHPLPATGPYMWASFTNTTATLVRNPYFHEWSHAARPDGYPDRIVFRRTATQTAGPGNYQFSFQQDTLWDQRWVR
jgi:YVTN family beta-propeller protein